MISHFLSRLRTARLGRAVDHCLDAGDVLRAEQMLQKALDSDPENCEFLQRLAAVHEQQGNLSAADQSIRRAISLESGNPLHWYRLGCLLQLQGRNDEAIAAYSRATEIDPGLAQANNNLGGLLQARGDATGAELCFREALNSNAALVQANHNLARLLFQQERFAEAEALLETAVAVFPYDPVLHNLRGEVFFRQKSVAAAAAAFEAGMRADPAYAPSYANLGRLLQAEGHHEPALRWFRESLDLAPDEPNVLVDMGVSLQALDRYSDALEAVDSALRRAPGNALAYLNRGFTLEHLGRTEEALQHYEKAIALDPDLVDAQVNRAMALLALGVYGEGFAAYESRLKKPELASCLQSIQLPLWQGGDLRGKTIVLRTEQAFGDMIQFARFMPPLVSAGARVLVDMLPELKRLYAGLPGIAGLVDLDEASTAEADCFCPIMSLPHRLGIRLENLPSSTPYLHLPDSEVSRWRTRLPADGTMKVGVVWSSSPNNRIARYKSIPLDMFRELFQGAHVLFVNLQKGVPIEMPANVAGPSILDLQSELGDFLDTACLVANLDLVISVDTAVAHLAGALGKPVWALLPYYADWRWLRGREDSPWYPTMRLFRQAAPGAWAPVVERVSKALVSRALDEHTHPASRK